MAPLTTILRQLFHLMKWRDRGMEAEYADLKNSGVKQDIRTTRGGEKTTKCWTQRTMVEDY